MPNFCICYDKIWERCPEESGIYRNFEDNSIDEGISEILKHGDILTMSNSDTFLYLTEDIWILYINSPHT